MLAGGFLVAGGANATTTATIIGDSSGCYGTDSTVNTELTTILTGLGYTVTSVDLNSSPFPTLNGVTQVWDIRCTTVLTSGQQTDYQAYLTSGGSLFLLGEAYLGPSATRDNSINSFVTSLGGGSPAVSGFGTDTQTVLSPFTGPISISSVTYAAVGDFTAYGTGSPVSQAGSSVGTVFWGPGTLSNATAGTVVAMLDVNPLLSGTLQADFVSNLASYLASPNPAPAAQAVPSLSEWSQMLLGLMVISMLGWQWRKQQN